MKRKLSLLLTVILVMTSFLTACQSQPSADETGQEIANVETETIQEEIVQEGIILADELKDLSIRDAKGFNGVVASANPYATKIGLDIMKNGGNAIDAAVAVSFTLGLVEPNASGPGGYGTMLIHDVNKKEQAFLDYMGSAPAALTQEIYETYDKKSTEPDRRTGKAALVPGAVDGWLKALDTYGMMTVDEILAPVIELAREGYEISPHSVAVLQDSYMNLLIHDETARVFLNEGLPYENGDIVKNEDYAKFLETIAEKGRAGFYEGPVAESIVKAVQETGGLMTMEDLAHYESKWREPIRIDYRGYEVVTAAPPSAGGVPLLESLQIIENADLATMEQNSVELLQLIEESLKYAHADRYNLVGDPDYVSIDTEGLTSESYAKYLFDNKIQQDQPSEDQKVASYSDYESPSTTHLTIMDKDGNMVSMTNTISLYYGCSLVPDGLGFALNSGTFNFSRGYEVNEVMGGNRARTTIAPTVVLKDGETYMAVGTPGGSRIPGTVLQVLLNVLDYKMGIQEAIEQPRIHNTNKGSLYVEGNMPETVKTKLEEMGHQLSIKGEMDSYFGGVHAIIRDQATGEMHGGADPRRDGKALAY
jgi:gamma-glutamyltranspeptidase/glutathione hydrolase